MDWILDSLEKSPQSKLPVWMLIAQIYWKDMVLLRRTARKLVSVLLFHLHEVSAPSTVVNMHEDRHPNRTTTDPKQPRQGHSRSSILPVDFAPFEIIGPYSSQLRLAANVVQIPRYSSCEFTAR